MTEKEFSEEELKQIEAAWTVWCQRTGHKLPTIHTPEQMQVLKDAVHKLMNMCREAGEKAGQENMNKCTEEGCKAGNDISLCAVHNLEWQNEISKQARQDERKKVLEEERITREMLINQAWEEAFRKVLYWGSKMSPLSYHIDKRQFKEKVEKELEALKKKES
jgi:hypothetical protein